MNGRGSARYIVAFVILAISLITYFFSTSENPITGEKQRVALSPKEEIAMGLNSAPEMAQQFGGLSNDEQANARVDRVGNRLLEALNRKLEQSGRENPYPFEFHLLADPKTVNAFALPGGQVFITEALYRQLQTEGQLAIVLGHEIGHVLERHSAEHIAKQRLTTGVVAATGAAADDFRAAQAAAVVGSMVNMKFGREDEKESDKIGVELAYAAGYDPRAIFGVMEVLEKAGGGGGMPEFMQTHPKPANRVAYAKEVLAEEFPEGIPEGLEP